MTPTILGRWQTRILLMATIGLIITLPFAGFANPFYTPFVILLYVTLLGLGWDVLYNALQTLRWDRDWPPIFFLFGAILEAAFLWGLLNMVPLPGVTRQLTLGAFTLHYLTVWLTTFLVMLGPLKMFFLQWRFQGGEWLGRH